MSEFSKRSKEEELNLQIVMMQFDKKELEQENADLRAQLEAAEEDKKEIAGTLDKSLKCIKKLEQERDNLQAANAVLREALERAHEFISNVRYCDEGQDECERCDNLYNDCLIEVIKQALSTTPAEAGERVRGLVEALGQAEDFIRKGKCCDEDSFNCDYCEDEYEDCLVEIITNALAKFRGGKENG